MIDASLSLSKTVLGLEQEANDRILQTASDFRTHCRNSGFGYTELRTLQEDIRARLETISELEEL